MKTVKVILIEHKAISIEDAKYLMYWTAKMAVALVNSGMSEQDIADQIEKKMKEIE